MPKFVVTDQIWIACTVIPAFGIPFQTGRLKKSTGDVFAHSVVAATLVIGQRQVTNTGE